MASDRTTELPGGLRIQHAVSRADRTRGLARRGSLPPTEAMWFPSCRSVHTFGMRFALDLIWLDGDGRVVRIDRDVRPRRLRTCLRARSVLECNAGAAGSFVAAGVPAALAARGA